MKRLVKCPECGECFDIDEKEGYSAYAECPKCSYPIHSS